jgi:soluble epoxide hydrolase / lipid-phosphate phosphatase
VLNRDRGSFLLSRLANFYPASLSKFVFLDIGYSPPGQGLTKQNVELINGMVQQHLAYSVFGYFLFFDEEGAAELIDKNVSFPSLSHGEGICWG